MVTRAQRAGYNRRICRRGGQFGKIHVFGGNNDSHIFNVHWILDPAAGTWTSGPPLPTPRGNMGAVAFGGRIYVIGGSYLEAGSPPLATVEIYDPVTGLWSTGPSMPTPRSGLIVFATEQRIYAIGGLTPALGYGQVFNTVEALDPATGIWSTMAPMPTARTYAAGALLAGRFHIFGGANVTGGASPAWNILASHEVYDPTSNVWAAAEPIPTARWNGIAGAAVGDALFAIGGHLADSTPTGAVDRYQLVEPQPVEPCEAELAAAQQQIQTLEGQLATADGTIQNLTQANQALTIQNGLLQSQVNALTGQNAQLQAANAQLATQLNAANQTIQDQQNQIAQLQTQVNGLLQENQALQSQRDQFAQQNQALQSQVSQLNSQLNALDQENQTLRAENAALQSPGPQVAAVIQDVQGLLANAPRDARRKLEQALKKLGDAQVFLGAGNLDHGIQAIKAALQALINAAEMSLDTFAFQRTLVEGVALRVQQAVADVEAVAGGSNKKVQQAKALLQRGQTLLTQGEFKKALEFIGDALQKASEARRNDHHDGDDH